MARAVFSKRWAPYRLLAFTALAVTLCAALLVGSAEKWSTTSNLNDEEVDAAFFSGLNPEDIPAVPEPTSLRPCCIFGNDIGARVGSIPVPGYEIRYVLELDVLGTHRFNKGAMAVQAGMEKRRPRRRSVGHPVHVPRRVHRYCSCARQRGSHHLSRFADRADRGHRRHDSYHRRRGAASHRRQAARPAARAHVRVAGSGHQSRRVARPLRRSLARNRDVVWLVVHAVLGAAVRLLARRHLLQLVWAPRSPVRSSAVIPGPPSSPTITRSPRCCAIP